MVVTACLTTSIEEGVLLTRVTVEVDEHGDLLILSYVSYQLSQMVNLGVLD